MDHRTALPGGLRRGLAAASVAALAVGIVPSGAAHAQVATPPPTPVDGFCTNVPATYAPFDDVPSSHTFADAIRCMEAAEITRGVRAGVYAPSATLTRDQMATLIDRMMSTALALQLGTDVPEEALNELPPFDGVNDFADVPDASVHVASVNRLADAGIVLGGPDGLPATSYGPDLPVTREQMTSFITRALEHLTGVPRATDNDYFSDDETSTHEANINALAEVGIVVGDGAGSFNPQQLLNRGQLSAFVMRSLANLEIGNVIAPLPAPTPQPSATFSTAASVDNGNGTATISFTVRNAANEGIDGLSAAAFSLELPGTATSVPLSTLLTDFPGTWGPFIDADVGDGVYTVLLTAGAGTYVYTDISVLEVVVDESLTVTITG